MKGMDRDYPPSVRRFADAFFKRALVLMEDQDRMEHTLERSAAMIAAPWEYEGGVVDETREVTFVRDFYNLFHELLHSCRSLDILHELAKRSFDQMTRDEAVNVVTYWSEAVLNEVYIFRERVRTFVTFVERKYGRDADFKEFVGLVCPGIRTHVDDALKAITSLRGAHVHQRRHRAEDPELCRLTALSTNINALGMEHLEPQFDTAIVDASNWLLRLAKTYGDMCWDLFDALCEVLAEGIVTRNDHIIVPMAFKDHPERFAEHAKETATDEGAPDTAETPDTDVRPDGS